MEQNIGKEVARLRRMTVAQLREKYADVFSEQTRSRHKDYLLRRIVWRLQANAEGDLSERARRPWSMRCDNGVKRSCAGCWSGCYRVCWTGKQQARRCPRCGSRRQHKGVRGRGVVSSVRAIRLEGPYWYCPRRCRRGEHALDALLLGSVSGVMEELLCLLGTSMASFGKAARASEKSLGVRLSTEMIWRLCHGVGRRVLAHAPPPPEVPLGAESVGSCDGTMVNTHQDGWRELKVYRYEHPGGVCGAAYLGRSERFAPRLG